MRSAFSQTVHYGFQVLLTEKPPFFLLIELTLGYTMYMQCVYYEVGSECLNLT